MPTTKSRFKSLLCFTSDADRTNSALPSANNDAEKVPNGGKANGAVARPRNRRHSASSNSSEDSEQAKESLLDQLKAVNIKNFHTLKDVALSGIKGEPINDKTYLMERIIKLATDLPYRSPKSQTLTKAFLSQLWEDLEHPPKSYLGNKYAFRQADGNNNNILWPHIGAAGQPYARSVRPKMMQPIARPDPGVLFDSLLARKEFKPHPNGISSALFYIASIIIHDIFHTSHKDFAISETSSYLDLAPLYGSNKEQQMLVRTLKDGKLKPDCFSDMRILGFPPGVGVLLIMFNRFHNQVVENLAKVDENGRFSSILSPPGRPPTPDGPALFDEALFQTGRLITTGLYVNVILKDYVRTILNLNSIDSKWNLDPRSEEGKSLIKTKIPEALGNQVSAEFNLVYRWHSCISQRDEEWTRDTYRRIVGEDTRGTSMSGLLVALQKWAGALPQDPQQRPFHDLERQSDGRLPDDKLASIWIDSVEDVAGCFGARHVPDVMRSVEMLGIIQARSWNLASLNEFRQYFKLTPYEKFEDINPDPYIVEQLRNLYDHPDHVELYPGILVEAAKKSISPGSGLCTNFTISRAILSDAVALVRSDRYYTVDYTPQNLTNFGFHTADSDISVDYGCVLHKLVLGALPNHFPSNSIYAHYPLVVPTRNKKILSDLKQAKFYDFERPVSSGVPHVINARDGTTTEAIPDLSLLWASRNTLVGAPPRAASRAIPSFTTSLGKDDDRETTIRMFLEQVVDRKMEQHRCRVGEYQQLDILRDVVLPAYTEFIRSVMSITDEDMQSIADDFDNHDLQRVLTRVYNFGFVSSPVPCISGHHRKMISKLVTLIESKIRHSTKVSTEQTDGLLTNGRFDKLLEIWGQDALHRMKLTGAAEADLVWNRILPDLALLLVSAARLSAQFIDALLGGDTATLPQVKALGTKATDESMRSLRDLIQQTTSHHSQVTVATRVKSAAALENGDSAANTIAAGQTVVYNLSGSLGAISAEMKFVEELHEACMTGLLQVLGRLEGLERTPGPQGKLKQVRDQHGGLLYLNDKESEYSHCPALLKVRWRTPLSRGGL